MLFGQALRTGRLGSIRVSGVDFKVEESPRRAGDSVAIFADPAKIKATLGWEPKHEDLDLICKTSLDWEKHLLRSN